MAEDQDRPLAVLLHGLQQAFPFRMALATALGFFNADACEAIHGSNIPHPCCGRGGIFPGWRELGRPRTMTGHSRGFGIRGTIVI